MAYSSDAFQLDPWDTLRVGEGFRLADIDTGGTPGFEGDKNDAKHELKAQAHVLGEQQERLYASAVGGGATDSALLVLQAMDTAGKGGIVRHVVGAVDPQGIALTAFKAPTAEELEHDFLWRVEQKVPRAGMIGVFDRSHYEDVLIGRVRQLADPAEIERRYNAIVDFETSLAERGVRIVKVLLHVGKKEQRERLAERLDRPDKHWKYNPGDVDERLLWDQYQDAYQLALERTDREHAPWFVVPADHKWYARIAVQHLLLDVLGDIDPQWPPADFDIDLERERLAAS
ncbi:hypothetical protein GCM10027416_18360 [Okibacterium endophyticum]